MTIFMLLVTTPTAGEKILIISLPEFSNGGNEKVN